MAGMSKPPPPKPPRSARKPNGSASAIALLQTSSLPALVQNELVRMIGAGDFPAGSKLNEAEVARMLGVSRGPVREAFRGLQEAGLVRLVKNRGVFVRQVSVEEADEIYEVRAALDELAGRRLAQMRSPHAVAELRGHVERMERAAARRDLDAYSAANLAFHDCVVALTGNAKLLATYRRLVNELNLYRRSALEINGTVAASAREHREIVELIAAGQAAGAGRALHDHVMDSRERMRRIAASPPPKPARGKTSLKRPAARRAGDHNQRRRSV
jgi:phosphonate utilization transcriptional regulator